MEGNASLILFPITFDITVAFALTRDMGLQFAINVRPLSLNSFLLKGLQPTSGN